MRTSSHTKLTAIFGNPVTHSLSPFLHNALYEREKVNAAMLAFGNASIEPLIAAMRALPIHMAAVTMPHKQAVMPLLDETDDEARAIGAVNTVVNREGELLGYNTDIVGIAKALEGVDLKSAAVLLIGAGGAARTIAYLLRREGATLYCMNRETHQAEGLVRSFGGSIVERDDLARLALDVVINATPIGMKPNVDAMPFPEELIRSGLTVFDLVYSPLETAFLKTARAKGARAISGLTMFLAQGLEQERLWLQRDIEYDHYSALLEGHVRSRG
jgi:shikimate dehydrogenase